jgi:hypothetical protein
MRCGGDATISCVHLLSLLRVYASMLFICVYAIVCINCCVMSMPPCLMAFELKKAFSVFSLDVPVPRKSGRRDERERE